MPGSRLAEGNEDSMELPRRTYLHLATAMATAPAFPRIVEAQAYPTRPITLIVPVAAGGTADVIGRMVADHQGLQCQGRLSRSVQVDTRKVSCYGNCGPAASRIGLRSMTVLGLDTAPFSIDNSS